MANEYGLNPLLKEMTVFPSKGGGVVPIVMVDGFIKMMNREPEYDGVELIENMAEGGEGIVKVESVTCTIHLKNRTHPIVITEYMTECYDGSKEPWKRWPRRMLRHKALIQGVRVAFGYSGIYDEDEGERIIEAQAVTDEAPMIGLRGASKTSPESPQPPVVNEQPPAQERVIDVEKEGKEALSGHMDEDFPHSSDITKTSDVTLREEVMQMIADIVGSGDFLEISTALIQYTKFGDFAGIGNVSDLNSTRKDGKRCMLEVTHSKVKQTWLDKFGKGE